MPGGYFSSRHPLFSDTTARKLLSDGGAVGQRADMNVRFFIKHVSPAAVHVLREKHLRSENPEQLLPEVRHNLEKEKKQRSKSFKYREARQYLTERLANEIGNHHRQNPLFT